MTLFAYLNGSDVGSAIRLNGIGLTSRADGSVGVGGIEFDDAAAALTVRGWMSVVVKETACTSAPVLFTGYIADRTYSRTGTQATYKVGSARFINANLIDQNAIMHINLITGADGKRPAETQVARIAWITGSNYWPGSIDQSLVDTTHVRPFEAADYRGQYADDVLNDIAGPIFRIFFIYPVQPNGNRGLFFDTPDAVTGTSTLTISNVPADVSLDANGIVTGTCYPPSIDASLTRDPSEVYARIRYSYQNGVVIESLSSTRDKFFLDNGLGYRGLQVDNTRVGLESTARSMADLLLARDAGEGDTISVTVQLPAAAAGLIGAGQRIGVRFQHLPGFETQVFTRVVARTIQQSAGTDALYDVALQLSTHGLSSAGGGGAPGPGTFPAPPPTSPSHYYSGSMSFIVANDGTGRQGGIADMSNPSAVWSTTVSSNTAGASFDPAITYTYNVVMTGFNAGDYSKSFRLDAPGDPGDNAFGTNVWRILPADGVYTATGTFNPTNTGTTAVKQFVSTMATPDAAHTITVVYWFDPAGWDTGGGAQPPMPGQWVYNETPTPTPGAGNRVFYTLWPYATGSLTVKVDDIVQTVTETDPATGKFTLAFDPRSFEAITCTYQGR